MDFEVKILESENSKEKVRGRNSQNFSGGVQNLIKDHGCMKSFFNIRAKSRSRRKLSAKAT